MKCQNFKNLLKTCLRLREGGNFFIASIAWKPPRNENLNCTYEYINLRAGPLQSIDQTDHSGSGRGDGSLLGNSVWNVGYPRIHFVRFEGSMVWKQLAKSKTRIQTFASQNFPFSLHDFFIFWVEFGLRVNFEAKINILEFVKRLFKISIILTYSNDKIEKNTLLNFKDVSITRLFS